MPYILALDQGTTSSRAIVFDDRGTLVASAQQEFTQHYPAHGQVEHNPEEIWESQLATARLAIRRAKCKLADIAAIGITNQRETTILWDRKTGNPVGPNRRAIVWQDRRTAAICDELKRAGHEDLVRQRTGLLIDPYFSATKIRWMLDHADSRTGTRVRLKKTSLRKRAEDGEIAFGTVDSWLIWNLTGGEVHATDITNASRTLLFNIHTLDWDDDLLDLFGVPRAVLPNVVPSSGVIGETEPGLLSDARRTRDDIAIPIAGVAGDQQAALFGQACFEPGMAKNTYGTGSFIVLNTGEEARLGDGVLTTIGWQLEGQQPVYAQEASIFITGAAVQWLLDGLGLIKTSAEVEDLANSVKDNGGVYFVPALTGLGAPHWDPYARGIIVGLTRGSTAAHLARATIEAMAYQTRDGIDAMQRATGIDLAELRVDGGAAANDMLLQFQADMLDTPVLRPEITETTALGAAYLAALGVGATTLKKIERQWKLDRRFKPKMKAQHRDARYRDWQRAVERSRAWADDRDAPHDEGGSAA